MAFINLRRKKGIYFGGRWEEEDGFSAYLYLSLSFSFFPSRRAISCRSIVARLTRAKPSAAESRGPPR